MRWKTINNEMAVNKQSYFVESKMFAAIKVTAATQSYSCRNEPLRCCNGLSSARHCFYYFLKCIDADW